MMAEQEQDNANKELAAKNIRLAVILGSISFLIYAGYLLSHFL